jgi:pimeloyl-ACP methyl ester carboxylesterase
MLFDIAGSPAYCYTGGKAWDDAKPTAVFIHGAQNDHSVWALQTRYFAHHGWNVLAVDLPGHGRSSGAPLASVEAMADWIVALLDRAGARQALLVGHSMGSLVALETAHRAPARVAGLALLGTAFPMKVAPMLLDAARDDVDAAIRMVNLWSHAGIAQKPAFPGPGAWTLGGSARLMERIAARNPAKVFHIDFTACNAYANGDAAAQSVRCPVLFVVAERDVMTPGKAAQGLIGAVADGRVVRIAASGHQMMAEQPDAVLSALYTFAGGIAVEA